MKRMTKDRLKAYRSQREEIKEIDNKIKAMYQGDDSIDNSTILDYRTGYGRPQTIVGVDWARVEKKHDKYNARKKKLEKECEEIEEYIEGIPDSITRRIFRGVFVDGWSLGKVGLAVHLDKSSVSRKINNYLKDATHATDATL